MATRTELASRTIQSQAGARSQLATQTQQQSVQRTEQQRQEREQRRKAEIQRKRELEQARIKQLQEAKARREAYMNEQVDIGSGKTASRRDVQKAYSSIQKAIGGGTATFGGAGEGEIARIVDVVLQNNPEMARAWESGQTAKWRSKGRDIKYKLAGGEIISEQALAKQGITSLKDFEAKEQKRMKEGGIVSEKVWNQIKDTPLRKKVGGYIPQVYMNIMGGTNQGWLHLDRPIISSEEASKIGHKGQTRHLFTTLPTGNFSETAKSIELGQGIVELRKEAGIKVNYPTTTELSSVPYYKKNKGVSLIGEYQKFLGKAGGEVTLTALGRDPEKLKKYTEWEKSFLEKHPLIKMGGEIIFETASYTPLFALFSPAMDTGAMKRTTQKTKVKSRKEEKKILDKVVENLRKETKVRQVKGKTEVKILNKGELQQHRLDQFRKVMNNINKEKDLVKKQKLLNQAKEIFRRAWGDQADDIAREWATQEGMYMPKTKEPPITTITLNLQTTSPPRMKGLFMVEAVGKGTQTKFKESNIQVQKTGMINWITPKTKTKQLTLQKDSILTSPAIKTQTKQSVFEKQLQNTQTQTKQRESLVTATRLRTRQATSMLNNTAQATKTQQRTRQRQGFVTSFNYNPQTRITPDKIKRPFPFLSRGKIKRKKPIQAKIKKPDYFISEERRFGKWKPVKKTRTKKEAFIFGVSKAKRTLGASTRVRTKEGRIIQSPFVPKGFRRSKREFGVLIEKRSRRLDNPFEIGEIQRAKRRNKKRKKKGNTKRGKK